MATEITGGTRTMAAKRLGTVARLAAALGFAAALLVGQALAFDSPAAASLDALEAELEILRGFQYQP